MSDCQIFHPHLTCLTYLPPAIRIGVGPQDPVVESCFPLTIPGEMDPFEQLYRQHAPAVRAYLASRLTLIPTMAKECRKFGISLILASQQARDFQPDVFSAIANYLVLRLAEPDARVLVRNVATSNQAQLLTDRIKQMERFHALYFSEQYKRPRWIRLAHPYATQQQPTG